jgi:hypothetical protein
MNSRLELAALNNALWCDAVCRAHGGDTMLTEHVWFNRVNSPPFYPNVDTLTQAGVSAQMDAIQALLAANLTDGWGVKDSFCTLDLAPLGFWQLFEAQWLWRDPEPAPKNPLPDVDWTIIRTPAELARWEAAWRGPDDPPLNLFLPALLENPDIAFLAAVRDGQIVAGAVANRTGDVVGLSNVFTPPGEKVPFWAGAIAAVHHKFPGLPLVGYESGEELDLAQSLGFETLGSLRVWLSKVG